MTVTTRIRTIYQQTIVHRLGELGIDANDELLELFGYTYAVGREDGKKE